MSGVLSKHVLTVASLFTCELRETDGERRLLDLFLKEILFVQEEDN